MSIVIFKEKIESGSEGITPFTTSYTTNNPKKKIDAVFFPHFVSENFLTDNMKQIMSVRPHVTNYEHNVIKTLCQNTLVIKI